MSNNINELIHKFDDINLFDINFKKPLKISEKSSNIPIYYNKLDMIFQSPKMNLPFGVSEHKNDNVNNKCLYLSFSNYGNDKQVVNFLTFMKSISKLMKTKCNKIDKKKREFVDPLYKPNNYSHSLKLKIYHNKNDKKEIIQIYDHNKNLIQLDDIEKNTYVKTLILIPHIWYTDIKCGYDCYVLQVKAYIHIRMLNEYCFLDDDDPQSNNQIVSNNKINTHDDINSKNKEILNDTMSNKIELKEHPLYKKYFKMLNYGVNIEQIQLQMEMEKLDGSIIRRNPCELIDLPSKTTNDNENDGSINNNELDTNNQIDISSLLVSKSNLKKTSKIVKKKKYKTHNMFYVGLEDVLSQINKLKKTNSKIMTNTKEN